jgi:glycerophosphoryl diester phosphodiesterase
MQISPLVIGHRGASALAPENTLLAFGKALDAGAAGVELDARLARDGVPVVIHDASLRRTGLCVGSVARMTSSELEKIDVGGWFNRTHPQLACANYERQFLPTLDQVFDFLKHHPNGPGMIYVELKTDKAGANYADLGDAVTQLVNAQGLSDRVVIVSFNLKALAHAKGTNPSLVTGALFEPRRELVKIAHKQTMIAAAIECGADQILLHRLIATRRIVAAATAGKLSTVVWTVDDPKWIGRATRSGVHAVITNDPAAMAAACISTH